MLNKICLLILMVLPGLSYGAFSTYELVPADSTLTIAGDSSLHEWKLEASDFTGEGLFHLPLASSTDIKKLDLKIPVAGLKSDSDSLAEKAQNLLQAKKYPVIEFSLEKIFILPPYHLAKKNVQVEGSLKVKGQQQPVKLMGEVLEKKGKVFMSGQHKLRMTQFDISPPKLLFLTTDDEIFINFNLWFQPGVKNDH